MYEQNKEKWKKERYEMLMQKKRDVEYQIGQLVDYPFIDIQCHISNGKYALDNDLQCFNWYQRGEYTLQQTISSFMYHHGIKEEDRTFEDSEFKAWLRSLGYEAIQASIE